MCDAEAETRCDGYVAFLRKAHSRRIPQKQRQIIQKIKEEENCDERKRKSERTCSFLKYYLRNTHIGQKSPLQNDKYFTALFRSP